MTSEKFSNKHTRKGAFFYIPSLPAYRGLFRKSI